MPDSSQTPPPAAPLKPSSFLTLAFLAVVAIVTAYILGVMAGRGGAETDRQPESPPHSLSGPIPQKPASQAILLPQDLDYARVLRNEKAREHARENAQPEAPAAREQGETKTQPVAEERKAPSNSDVMHDYVFQLGAFKDEDIVDTLRQKLEGRGFRTRMQKEGKLYIVLVLLRGNAERAAEVAQAARELQLGDPIMRSKKSAPEF